MRTLFKSIQEAEDLYREAIKNLNGITKISGYTAMCNAWNQPVRKTEASKEKQFKQWKTAITFRRKGNDFYGIRVLTQDEHIRQIVDLIIDNDKYYVACCLLDCYNKFTGRDVYYITNRKLNKLMGYVDSSYYKYFPTFDNETTISGIQKLEQDIIDTGLNRYPEIKKIKEEIKKDRQKQIDKYQTQGEYYRDFGETKEDRELEKMNFKMATKLQKAYNENDPKPFTPNKKVAKGYKDSYDHINASLNYNIQAILTDLNKYNWINYRPVTIGVKLTRTKQGEIIRKQEYKLSDKELDQIAELKNRAAKEAGLYSYARVVAQKLFKPFNEKFLSILKDETGYDYIYQSNRIYITEDFKKYINLYNSIESYDEVIKKCNKISKEFKNKMIENNRNRTDNEFERYFFKLLAQEFLAPDASLSEREYFFYDIDNEDEQDTHLLTISTAWKDSFDHIKIISEEEENEYIDSKDDKNEVEKLEEDEMNTLPAIALDE